MPIGIVLKDKSFISKVKDVRRYVRNRGGASHWPSIKPSTNPLGTATQKLRSWTRDARCPEEYRVSYRIEKSGSDLLSQQSTTNSIPHPWIQKHDSISASLRTFNTTQNGSLDKPSNFVGKSKCNFLLGFQRLFSEMSLSDVRAVATDYLNKAFGWEGNQHLEQQDIQ